MAGPVLQGFAFDEETRSSRASIAGSTSRAPLGEPGARAGRGDGDVRRQGRGERAHDHDPDRGGYAVTLLHLGSFLVGAGRDRGRGPAGRDRRHERRAEPTRSRTCSSASGSAATRRATSTRWASCRPVAPRRRPRRASRLPPAPAPAPPPAPAPATPPARAVACGPPSPVARPGRGRWSSFRLRAPAVGPRPSAAGARASARRSRPVSARPPVSAPATPSPVAAADPAPVATAPPSRRSARARVAAARPWLRTRDPEPVVEPAEPQRAAVPLEAAGRRDVAPRRGRARRTWPAQGRSYH